MVREAREGDLRELLELYQYLHEKEVPGPSRQLSAAWRKILEDPDHHLLVNIVDGKSSPPVSA